MSRLDNFLRQFVLCVLALTLCAQAPHAQPAPEDAATPEAAETDLTDRDAAIKNYTGQINVWAVQTNALEAMVADEQARDTELRELPGILEGLRQELRDFTAELEPKLNDARARLDQLGPPPKEDAPPEAPEISGQRAELGTEVATYDSLIKQADVLLVKIGQLINAANQARRERFTRSLLEPVANYYSADFWRRAVSSIPFQLRWFSTLAADWFDEAVKGGVWRLLAVIAAMLVAAGLTRVAARGIGVKPRSRAVKADGSLRDLAGASAIIGGLRACAPILAALAALYISALATNLAWASLESILLNVLLILASATFLVTVIFHGFWPAKSLSSLIETDQTSARRLTSLLIALVAIWAFDRLLTLGDPILLTPYPLIVFRSLVVALTTAALTVSLLTIPITKKQRGRAFRYRGWPAWLVGVLGLIAAAIAFAGVLGYVALARFAATQLIITGGVLFVMYLLHLWGEYIWIPSDRRNGVAANADEPDGPSPIGTVRVILSLLFDIAILLIGSTILLLLWRFDWVEVQGWIATAFVGVQVGGLTISLQAILIAVAVFVLGLVLTRTVQRWVVTRTAISDKIESGIRESIITGIGYSGFALATIAAISYLGISFSNLAIVAGALSVGIGFGLQSIFNNFASGLILLVERPIKVGDWITVGENEGFVRKISVRSTEIETVQRQSVIVPNADLITNTVINWMHTDKIGRLEVPIGVSYGTDVEKFRALMLEIADAHPAVVKSPQPVVHFAGYGDSSLDFELRVFLRDIGRRIPISSELRYSIWFALQDADIHIPFPQRDLHIKDFEGAPELRPPAGKKRRQNGPKPARRTRT